MNTPTSVSWGLVSGRSVYELCHENRQVLGWANVSIAPGGGGGQADWAVCRCMEIRLAGDWRAEKDGRGVMRNLERCCILFSFMNPATQSTYRQTPIFLFVSMLWYDDTTWSRFRFSSGHPVNGDLIDCAVRSFQTAVLNVEMQKSLFSCCATTIIILPFQAWCRTQFNNTEIHNIFEFLR